jgi:hypothetical protein
MRRALTIFLILNFWLGPLAAILPASEDSRLPPCCRRHGAHHCAMAMRMAAMMAQAASGKPTFTAPNTCPSYPGSAALLPPVIPALAAATVSLPVPLAQPHSPAAARAAARLSQIRTRAGRGPPATNLA